MSTERANGASPVHVLTFRLLSSPLRYSRKSVRPPPGFVQVALPELQTGCGGGPLLTTSFPFVK